MAKTEGRLTVYLKCETCKKRGKVQVVIDEVLSGNNLQNFIARAVQEKGWDLFDDGTEKHSDCLSGVYVV